MSSSLSKNLEDAVFHCKFLRVTMEHDSLYALGVDEAHHRRIRRPPLLPKSAEGILDLQPIEGPVDGLRAGFIPRRT